MFSGRPSVPLSVRASVRPSMIHVVVSCFRDNLQYLLTDFRQTFVTGASWDTDGLIAFLGQKVKVQGHTISAEAHSTRRYRRVQLFLVFGLKFANNVHYKFKSSQASKARFQSSKRTAAKQNLT